jgi:hypothetical protein
MKFLTFTNFMGHFALLDPDPDSESGSESGSGSETLSLLDLTKIIRLADPLLRYILS